MKTFIVATVLLVSQFVFAAHGPLDGKTYCRTVNSERKHCLSFSKGYVRDSANTFFGNPPESAAYSVLGNKVSFGNSDYVLSDDKTTLSTISGSTVAGVTFTLEKKR